MFLFYGMVRRRYNIYLKTEFLELIRRLKSLCQNPEALLVILAFTCLFLNCVKQYPVLWDSYSYHLPMAADGILLLAALVDFLMPPSSRKIDIRRPLPYPLAVDLPNEISLEITNRTEQTVRMIIRDDVPPRCKADN